MSVRKSIVRLMGYLSLVMLGVGAQAIPPNLSISGQLLDNEGHPVRYYEPGPPPLYVDVEVRKNLAAKLLFFEDQSSTVALQEMPVTASVYNGLFEISFQPTPALLTEDELSYEIAIDLNEDGFDADDAFEGRFRVASVPFALSAAPSEYYPVFVGRDGMSTVIPNENISDLAVAPFLAPAGGIRLNRLHTFIKELPVGSSFSLGIYDADGSLVVKTQTVAANDTVVEESFLELSVPKVDLQPSKMYFLAMAVGRTNAEPFAILISFPTVHVPSIPLLGMVTGAAPTADVPASFDLGQLVPSYRSRIPPVTFSYVDESSPKSMKALEDLPMSKSGKGYRWIPSR